jgi:transposase
MVVLGIDAHKRTHTVVAVDDAGRQLGVRVTRSTSTAAHLDLVHWAGQFGPARRWAVEDCRHLSRRLEADLLAAGEQISRVPPKLMAATRKSARTYGKSDPIDALAVARAALREPGLPTARLDGPERELRLLTDHRDDLVAERTRAVNRLRWHLHELDPDWDPKPRSLTRRKTIAAVTVRLAGLDGLVARLAAGLAARISELTIQTDALEQEIAALVRQLAPSLLALPGAGPDRRQDRRRDRRRRPVHLQGRLRPAQRHRAAAGVVSQQGPAPAVADREPATELCHPPHRGHPAPLPPRRPRLPPAPHRGRKHQDRSHPRPQTTPLRRRLPSPPSRRSQPPRPGSLT